MAKFQRVQRSRVLHDTAWYDLETNKGEIIVWRI